MSQQTIDTTETTLYCYNHPDRETMLRCNRCGRPICTACAVLTPTGYRCKECVRGQLKTFDTAQWFDYPLSFLIAGIIAYLGAMIASRLGFFTIFIAPIIGVFIAEAVRWVVRKRRSKLLWRIAAAGVVIGGGLPVLFNLLLVLIVGGGNISLFALLWPAIYLFLATSTAYYRMSGIQIR